MSRDEMIAVLVNDTVERMVVLRQVFWLQGILENGFAGFAQWSDAELRRELGERGIGLEDSLGESADSDTLDQQEDDDEFLRRTGHIGSNSQLQYLQD